MAAPDWYASKEALVAIEKFHNDFARQPPEMEEAKNRHVVIMNELENHLKRERETKMINRMEFTGSAYEGLKVGIKELEFDVMFIFNDGLLLKVEKDATSNRYGHLTPINPDAEAKFKSVTENGEVVPMRVRSKFHSELQKWLNKRESDTPKLRGEIKIFYSGPAIRATVHRNGKEWYFVDLVPAYEVRNGYKKELYVAKPRGNDDTLWRHSLSVEEKSKLNSIDGPDNGCRKKIVRILKVVRDSETGLKKMVSFYIKILIIEMTDRTPALDWSQKNLAVRLQDVLLEMVDHMEKGVLNHPFCEDSNILQELSPAVRQNIASRLKKIATNVKTAKSVFKCSS